MSEGYRLTRAEADAALESARALRAKLTAKRDSPGTLPLLVTGSLAEHAVVCQGCGSLVLNNRNAISAHLDFHRALDGAE